MKKKEFLFRLIKSLNKGEKIFLRKLAAIYVNEENNNYLKLLNALDQQEEYDEKALRKSLKGESVLKHLAESKYQLQKLIFKSLNSFHSAASVNMQLRDLLNTIEILYEKGLVNDIGLLIKKGKPIAQKYERFSQLLEFLKWERKLLFLRVDPKTFEETDKALLEEIKILTDQECLLYKCNALRHPLMVIYEKQNLYTKETKVNVIKATFNSLLNEMKKMEEKVLSFESRRALYFAYSIYNHLIQDNKGLYTWSDKTVKLIEANLHIVSETPFTYILALRNHMGCLLRIGQYQKCLEVGKKLKAAPLELKISITETIEYQIFLALSNELNAYVHLGRFQEAIVAAKDAEIRMERFKEKIHINSLIVMCYSLAFIYFATRDFSNAIKWVNKLVNGPQLEGNSKNIFGFTRILNQMIHFEKGNKEMLEYLSKSTFRYLQKQGELYKCEIVFLDYIHKLSITSTFAEQSQLFKELKKKIEELKNDPGELEIIESLYISVWIDSKLNGRAFEEEYLKTLKSKIVSN